MSLGIVIKGPEGIVMAAESRIILTITNNKTGELANNNFDNATKVFSFNHPNQNIGVVTYGQAAIGLRTVHSYIPEFESTLPSKRLSVEDFTRRLSDFMQNQWEINKATNSGQPMTFLVGGFNEKDAYGRVYSVDIPTNPNIVLKHDTQSFGITWGGQRELVDRLIKGFDVRIPIILEQKLNLDSSQKQIMMDEFKKLGLSIPIQFLPLQDCIDLAILLIKTTIDVQKLSTGIRGCGGFIDVLTITRSEGLKFVQKRK